MSKAIRCIGIIVLLAAVVGCDVFFVSREGRYNPLDPDNEFVEVYPEIDGYAEETGWYDASALLIAQNSTIMSVIVIRFDVSEIPDDFDRIYLRLYKSVQTAPETVVRIHPIIMDWAPPIYYSLVDQPGFFNIDVSVRHYPQINPGVELINLDPIVAGSTDSIRYGIVIFSEFDRIEFQAMKTPDTLWKPRLYISTK